MRNLFVELIQGFNDLRVIRKEKATQKCPQRLGVIPDKITTPDDFDTMGQQDIQQQFEKEL